MRTAPLILSLAALGWGQSAKFPFTKYRMGDFGPDNVSQTSMADFDKDGDLDFASGKRFGTPGEVKMVWWEYQGPDKWVRYTVNRLGGADAPVGLARLPGGKRSAGDGPHRMAARDIRGRLLEAGVFRVVRIGAGGISGE